MLTCSRQGSTRGLRIKRTHDETHGLQQIRPTADAACVAPTTQPSSPQCNEEQGSVNTPTAVPTTAVHHGDLHCTPLYKSTESKSEVTNEKRTEYDTCTTPGRQAKGGGLSTSTAKGSISGGDSTPISAEESTQTSLPSCDVDVQCTSTAAPAVLDWVTSRFYAHGPRALHGRFLLEILLIVQQAHCGSPRLCHQLVASLDQDVAQLASSRSLMAAARQPMVRVRCSTIHGLRPSLLSARSVSGAT